MLKSTDFYNESKNQCRFSNSAYYHFKKLKNGSEQDLINLIESQINKANIITSNVCSKCKLKKPFTKDFWEWRSDISKLRTDICLDCTKKRKREAYQKNKEHYNNLNYQWRQNNKEKISNNIKIYYENNKEKFAAYKLKSVENNREQYLNYWKEYNKNSNKRSEYREKFKDQIKQKAYIKTYGMNFVDQFQILCEQNFKCKISDKEITIENLATDHCHKCGKFRGFLEHGINSTLGMFKDDVNIIEKAIDYLNNHELQLEIGQIIYSNKFLYNTYNKNWNKKERQKNNYLKHFYKISLHDELLIKKVFGNNCMLSGENSDKLVVDHCHKTGIIRGLIKNEYNIALGRLNENKNYMNNMIKYLNDHKC